MYLSESSFVHIVFTDPLPLTHFSILRIRCRFSTPSLDELLKSDLRRLNHNAYDITLQIEDDFEMMCPIAHDGFF